MPSRSRTSRKQETGFDSLAAHVRRYRYWDLERMPMMHAYTIQPCDGLTPLVPHNHGPGPFRPFAPPPRRNSL